MQKTTLAIVIAFAVLIAAVFAQDKDKNDYQKPVIAAKTCPRTMDVNFSNGKKTIIVNTNVGACTRGDDKKRMAKMQFTMSSVGIPRVTVASQKNKDDKNSALRLGFAIDRVVEYREKNGAQGYQPGEDDVIQTYKLASAAWSDIVVVKNDVDAANSVYDLSTTLNTLYASQIKLSVSVTPIEISFRVQNTTVQRTVLTPNSFKVSFSMNGIKYSSTNSTGLSVGVIVASKGSMGKRGASRSALFAAQTATEITTDTVSTDQEVHDIDDENDATSKAAFFSLKKFVFKYTPAGALSSTTVPVATSAGFKDVTDATEKAELNGVQAEGSDLNLKRMWFTPMEKVTDFIWDPTLGSNEGTSGASAAKISFMVLFASFIIALLFL